MKPLVLILLFAATAAGAQDQGVQRALIQRDQESDAFALQLRQSQEALKVPPANRPAVEALQLWERQRLDNLSAKQLESRPDERFKAAQERRAIAAPVAP